MDNAHTLKYEPDGGTIHWDKKFEKRFGKIYLRHVQFQLSYPSGKSSGESSLLVLSTDSVKKVATFGAEGWKDPVWREQRMLMHPLWRIGDNQKYVGVLSVFEEPEGNTNA